MSFGSRPGAKPAARAAASLYIRYCMPSAMKGERHTAAAATIPNEPTALLMSPAPATTVPAASEMMPPTTGRAVEMALLAARSVTASAAPLTAPVRER